MNYDEALLAVAALQRYYLPSCQSCINSLEEDTDGEWVKIEDVLETLNNLKKGNV